MIIVNIHRGHACAHAWLNTYVLALWQLSPTHTHTHTHFYLHMYLLPTCLPTMYMRTDVRAHSHPGVYIVHADGCDDTRNLTCFDAYIICSHSMCVVIAYVHGSPDGAYSHHVATWQYKQTCRLETLHTVHAVAVACSFFTVQNTRSRRTEAIVQIISRYFFHRLMPNSKTHGISGGTFWIGNVRKSAVNTWHSYGRFLWRLLLRGLL